MRQSTIRNGLLLSMSLLLMLVAPEFALAHANPFDSRSKLFDDLTSSESKEAMALDRIVTSDHGIVPVGRILAVAHLFRRGDIQYNRVSSRIAESVKSTVRIQPASVATNSFVVSMSSCDGDCCFGGCCNSIAGGTHCPSCAG